MDKVFERVSGLFHPDMASEMMAYAESSFLRDMVSGAQSRNIRMLSPDPNVNSPISFPPDFIGLSKTILTNAKEMRFPPPQVLPCGNIEPAKYTACTQPGTRACSECRLVSYCSKACQIQHWPKHKRDCKNAMRSDSWRPIWEREGRPPSFCTDMDLQQEFQLKREEEFSIGMPLWGNTPAMDILNLKLNENEGAKDLSLAFIASGDLRHVLTTVNGLPMTYSGQLSILINDLNPLITCRNIVLLLILGTIEDETLAVDMAIHFWYSIFMPSEYKLRMSLLLTEFLMQVFQGDGDSVFPLGEKSTLSSYLSWRPSTKLLQHIISSALSVGDVQQEYDRVRTAPSRGDFRDRMYLGLRPSHRVAFEEYRRFGVVLPFGALNAHFNCPNNSLFSPDGKWMQTDYADPLEGWDMAPILAAGKAHGAQSEDVYGCFYFFLSQELRHFVQRVRAFKISFTVSTLDAGNDLPMAIRNGELDAVPSTTRFDRIAVSNIFDDNYVGMRKVVMGWSPFLAESPYAAIVGYFMNWFAHHPGGSFMSASKDTKEAIIKSLSKKKLGDKPVPPKSFSAAMNLFQTLIFAESADADAFYDNSVPFREFLKNRGLDDVLRKSKLKLRTKHTIVPHRIMAPLQGKPSDLPVFPDDDSWYYNTKLTAFTWSERYVEFTRTL